MQLVLMTLSLVLACVVSIDRAKSRSRSKATFAGGCFWCMEPPFEKLDGVFEVVSGYSGGPEENPTYQEVSAGMTGHREVVQVGYDPAQVSYAELLDVFWRQIDPTDSGGQFADRGSQYASDEYQALLTRARMVTSMSRKGNCYDNAPVESFFGTFKTELVFHQQYATRAEARLDIFEYIEVFYNRFRRHSALGYKSPVKYEALPLGA